jgi:hypothetical protein
MVISLGILASLAILRRRQRPLSALSEGGGPTRAENGRSVNREKGLNPSYRSRLPSGSGARSCLLRVLQTEVHRVLVLPRVQRRLWSEPRRGLGERRVEARGHRHADARGVQPSSLPRDRQMGERPQDRLERATQSERDARARVHARGTHGPYAFGRPNIRQVCGAPSGGYDYLGAGPTWRNWSVMLNARNASWFGFGGAWGGVGELGETTGPLGPSFYKSAAPPECWQVLAHGRAMTPLSRASTARSALRLLTAAANASSARARRRRAIACPAAGPEESSGIR